MLVSLTVGKVDAGVTVLLTPDKRLIEFPSILLPPNIASGSIVDITVARNREAEAAADARFVALQDRIFSSFGAAEPTTPALRCRNATQTSVVLEWDPVELATADLLSLSLYRNGQKAGNIPRPLQMHSTKISGLAVDTEYTFHLVLRTTAGTYASPQVAVRTHKMTDLSGVTITAGVLSPSQREDLARAVARVGAKIVDGVRIDTTHFVTSEGRGLAWEKAVEMNIPVVRPEWVDACERSGRILGVTKFYLDAVRPPVTPGPGPGPGPADDDSLQRRGSSATTAPAVGASAAAPGTPATPAAIDKELPERPAENGNTSNGSRNDADTEQKKDDNENSGSSESDEDDEEEEEKEDEEKKAKSNGGEGEETVKAKAASEQKVRLEDKDTENLAVRPPSSDGGSVEPVIRDPNEEEDAKLGGGSATSPGDGASFQDVAL
ncbi:hypothetical protein SLS62_010555 [Diatrype stigma]|uniref:Chitin biosynthesis protein CHS5 n=1 Tax=Diatrype stigma TaxID=117547 RepID=A0AAN9UBM3_9PEZI